MTHFLLHFIVQYPLPMGTMLSASSVQFIGFFELPWILYEYGNSFTLVNANFSKAINLIEYLSMHTDEASKAETGRHF